MLLRIHLILVIIAITTLSVSAQVSNLRKKKIIGSGTVILDSLSIVPHSVLIPGCDSSYFALDAVNGILNWKKAIPKDSIDIIYRVFPTRLNAVAKRFTYDSIINNFIAQPSAVKNISGNNNSLFNFNQLNYNGSFGRSLSFGNNQDAVFNSQFNLQLSGLLGDSIQMAAALTDNNIPIQPDGTTQQLNEFDKVLLLFKKKNWEINLGDIDLRQNQSYFLHFYKRLQGISYEQKLNYNKNIIQKTTVSGAIAKGKFARNILPVQEGNQGPYRLQGNNNEFYLIVLAGTEKVFIDGIQMQRGEDQDYVINYNTAEVSFTPKQMITKDKRVQVEFEYADRSYLNSMLYLNNELAIGKKLKLNISAYSNADAKNSPINQTMDAMQKQFLSQIGDSIQNAFYPVAAIDSFSTAKILYKRIDTLYNGKMDSIYVYSTDPANAKYSLSFVETGPGRGNYIPLFNAANGKVFQWIQPVNGLPQGSFEPAQFLVTPKKQEILSIGTVYQLNEHTSINAEIAGSKYDVNTFSKKNKANDGAFAGKFAIHHTQNWKTAKGKQRTFNADGGYEWVDKNFQPIERLRPVEFARDWGLNLLPTPATEQLPHLSFELADEKNNRAKYLFSSYIRSDGYKGFKNSLQHNQELKGWVLNDVLTLTHIHTPKDQGFYLRPSIDLSKSLPAFHNYTVGASYAMEHNEIKNMLSDTLTPLSFAFETISAYIKSDRAKENHWAFTYFTRKNQLPYEKKLLQTDRSNNYNFQTELLKNAKHQFHLNVTYRQLFITHTTLTTQKPDNSLLGRAEYYVNEWNGFLTGNMLYELGAGQEQRRDFSYIEVAAGRGQYAWIDYNNDGIPQLNEFEIAVFQDQAKYIKVFTPTNEFIKANYNQFNYNFSLNPKAIANTIRNKHFKNFITRFNLQSSLQTAQKQVAKGNPAYNPFKGKIADTALIQLNYIVSNTLSFNRSGSIWGLDITNLTNYNKSLLTYGFESRQMDEWTFKGRWNIAGAYTIEFIQKNGKSDLKTPSFENRNYAIKKFSSEPKFTYTSGTTYRVQMGYQFLQKNNSKEFGGEHTITHSLSLETKYNAVQNTSVMARFTFSNISFDGLPNTPVSYMMLDGLLAGKNFLWTIDFTKRLINNLEINFQYEGRKPGETKAIHTGRASIRALL